jgi:hypothetical protein
MIVEHPQTEGLIKGTHQVAVYLKVTVHDRQPL